MRLGLVFIMLAVLAACSSSTQKEQVSLFDTKQFFEQEVLRLTQEKVGLKKLVMLNTAEDSVAVIHQVNWSIELQPFLQLDLAKPVNRGSFNLDSMQTQEGVLMNYTAKDSLQKIDAVSIWFDQNHQPIKLRAEFRQHNQFYAQQKQLTYVRDSGFTMETKQYTSLTDSAYFRIIGTLTQP